MFFWRDHTGHEIDLVLGNEYYMDAIEIKSSQTVRGSMFQNLAWFSDLVQENLKSKSIVYAGNQAQNRANGKIIPWQNITLNLDS